MAFLERELSVILPFIVTIILGYIITRMSSGLFLKRRKSEGETLELLLQKRYFEFLDAIYSKLPEDEQLRFRLAEIMNRYSELSDDISWDGASWNQEALMQEAYEAYARYRQYG